MSWWQPVEVLINLSCSSRASVVLIGIENRNIIFLRHYDFVLRYYTLCMSESLCMIIILIYFSDLLFCLTLLSWLNCCFNFPLLFLHICNCMYRIVQDKMAVVSQMYRGAHFFARWDMLVMTCHLSLPSQPELRSVNIKKKWICNINWKYIFFPWQVQATFIAVNFEVISWSAYLQWPSLWCHNLIFHA